MPAVVRIFDPYAIALSLLVGLVGFGMNFFFNTDISSWGMNEIGYPAMAMGYVYIRNARFFETDEETGDKLFNKGTGEETAAGSGVTGQKVRAPPVDLPGLSLVAGHALTAPDEGALAVIFFFATWCANCKRCLPAILALAERYTQEGVTFAGVTKEPEDDLRFFVETYHRPVKSTTLLSDGNGALTAGYQGAYGVKTIPHCYLIRGGADGIPGEIEWHGHPTQLETALGYYLDNAEERESMTQKDKEGESAVAGSN